MPSSDAEAQEAPGPFAGLSLDHVSTVDRVAEELRRALFEGELEPGTPLREVALTEALAVSRSTIREALGVLVAEGLVVREAHRGVRVAQLDPAALRDVSRARAVLEVAGVRRWREAGEEEREACHQALTDFEEAARAGASAAELTAAHLAIHRALVGLTGSPRLAAWADALTSEIRLALARVDRIKRNSEDQVHSHRHLLDLLERDDVEGAAAEIEQHLANAERSMLEAAGVTAPQSRAQSTP